jgi:ribosome-binding protein aMBF1 (putative translation factor)
MKNISWLIKTERIKNGWNQVDLAKKLGCNQTFVSMIELEKRGCPNWVIEKCSGIFGENFLKGAVSAKKYYIESINRMLENLGTDKLIVIEDVVRWATWHGVVR